MEYVTLNNGVKMPMLGFGVWQVFDAQVCEESVASALRTGYRLVDTAAAYMNEEAVGRAVASAMERDGISREELFITTKLWVQDAGYENTKTAIQSSLDKLGLDYLDLYLVHQPLGDYYGHGGRWKKPVKRKPSKRLAYAILPLTVWRTSASTAR